MTSNDAQVEYWNGDAGARWAEAQEQLDRLLQPLSEVTVGRADPRHGERVIDVGCGCGATTMAIAERGADVWGMDISAPMLARARERAAGLTNVTFAQADAATHPLAPEHDLVFSRFGIMFFADPVAAFANLRTGLRPGGRMTFVCWQAPQKNAWIYVAGKAIQPHLPEPVARPDPREPGPFAFADEDYVAGILADAGFTDVHIESAEAELHLADTLDEAVDFQGKIGPVARVLAELDGEHRATALEAARAALAEHETPRGINLGAAAWIVSAAAPDR